VLVVVFIVLSVCTYVCLSVCVVYSPNGVAAVYRNDVRQLHVNRVADSVGAGIGTGRFVGVPGTNLDFGYGYYSGYAGYPGYPGYRPWTSG